MKTIALVLLLLSSGLSAAQTAPAAPPSPRDLHVAACVAALDVQTRGLAGQIKAGDDTLRTTLLDRLLAGAAFIGDNYLHSRSDDKQARVLLDKALEDQKSLPAAELAARQGACTDEGSKLYMAANIVEQAVVKRLAGRRMDKLLRP